MNAITTSSTLALAKPEKACAGVIVPVRTTVPTAIIEAVRSGKAPRSTRRDGGDEDREQVPRRRREAGRHRGEPDADRDREGRRALQEQTGMRSWPRASCGWLAGSNAALEPDGAPLDRAILRLDHELPGELIGARRAGIPARAAQDRPGDVVSSPRCLRP